MLPVLLHLVQLLLLKHLHLLGRHILGKQTLLLQLELLLVYQLHLVVVVKRRPHENLLHTGPDKAESLAAARRVAGAVELEQPLAVGGLRKVARNVPRG